MAINPMTLLVTGGAGFIGANLIHYLWQETDVRVVNVDKLSYAGHLESLAGITQNDRYAFEQVDIAERDALARVFERHQPDGVIHLAAESHVDRSIDAPADFIQSNIIGTYVLLEQTRRHWEQLTHKRRDRFRFHHVSTDEVYGDLGDAAPVAESSTYAPNSPYSASKAASDHLVRAWHKTYGVPVVISNCSNNYGPYQHPEKLIPLTVLNAAERRRLPVYGDGGNVRDWLHVGDHVRALHLIFEHGRTGEVYNIGSSNEQTNLAVVHAICDIMEDELPSGNGESYRALIEPVADRPGHDRRYAIDATKLRQTLGWEPRESFFSGLRKTIRWYLDNREWCQSVQGAQQSRERLGLGAVRSS